MGEVKPFARPGDLPKEERWSCDFCQDEIVGIENAVLYQPKVDGSYKGFDPFVAHKHHEILWQEILGSNWGIFVKENLRD